MSKEYNFEATRGDTLKFELWFKYTSTGLAVNITGWTIWFTLKRRDTDSDAAAVVRTSLSLVRGL